MQVPDHIVKCLLCGNDFKMGPGDYDGKWVKRYEMHVCSSCYSGFWDGYADHNELIESHLLSRNLPFLQLNDSGHFPRD